MKTEKETKKAADIYPGADINVADNEKVTERLERERTKTLNNNPRDNDDKM